MGCAGPADWPFTVMFTVHWPGVAVCVKKKVAGNALPSESYTVVEVDWLNVLGSVGTKPSVATLGGTGESAGRFKIAVPVVVTCGALCAVCRFRSSSAPVLKPPVPVGGYTCSAWPVPVTTLPFLSSENSPLRVYTVPLVGSCKVKNPSPLIARSRFDEVVLMLPWVNCCAVDASRTPSPTAEVFRFTAPAANTSANSAREPLKPTVSALATLLAVTSKSELAAVNPDNAILKAAI